MKIELNNPDGIILNTEGKYCPEDILIKPNLQEKSVIPSEIEQVTQADSGYVGLNRVTISGVNLQNKSVTPSETEQIVQPDSNYLGLKKVTVASILGVVSDATATVADILSGKTAYIDGGKLSGTIQNYNGTTDDLCWKATVSNLGAENPDDVVFDVIDDVVPNPWSEITFKAEQFIRIEKMYKKILTVADNQITSFSIANKKLDADYKIYPCFIDEDGNELDYILIKKEDQLPPTVAITPKRVTRNNVMAMGAGYQVMDWRIHKLWLDLIICAHKTVNPKVREGEADAIGLEHYYSDWIDGCCNNDSTWIYSNTPSKYIDAPTELSEGYSAVSAYTTPPLSASATNKQIKKLGYDPAQPFFNYPSETIDNNPLHNTYYCGDYIAKLGNNSTNTEKLDQYRGGAFTLVNTQDWKDTQGYRICYRPISS